ncbi:GlcG/HbpS family heme-binding protein [Mycolicibacterium baixiangningiae]|uniref:GlcG/HbpS family heme-binding protein n=1 Tax=Mycolicibacterium baixiangningiae TaxID=2761578 RepID=UPI001E446130|nr:heme-binding protein [Mycolicibacterium baixiangningiae]
MLSAMNVDLSTASRIVAAVHAEAVRRSVLVSAAVVDAGGHLVAFGRMDGAEIAGPVLAVDKAFTAVANRVATSELARLAAPGGDLFGLHANGGGRFVIFGGGVPIFAKGDIVGGVGVSGASAADDEGCALAGVAVVDLGALPGQS